jgi:hypothetical protein
LNAAQSAYQDAINNKSNSDASVMSAQSQLSISLSNKQNAQQAVDQAQTLLQKAQTDYDTLLISDPSWVRPLIEQTYTVDVPYTVQVPYVVQESSVIQVPTTQTISTTIRVPVTTQVEHTTYTIVGGITADVFNRRGYNAAPPLPSATETPYATSNVSQINFQWGSGNVMNTDLSEDVIVRFTGNLVVPADGNYYFYAPADDGVILSIDGAGIIYDWRDKGGGGSQSQAVYLKAGTLHPFTFYYYENGGGAWVQFYARTDSSSYQIIPASWMGTQSQAITTYESVTTYQDVTTYTDVITYHDETIYNDVTYYRDETLYRQEQRTRMVPDENASAPLINDLTLLPALNDAKNNLSLAQDNLASAEQSVTMAQSNLDSAISDQAQKASIINVTSSDVTTKQQELNVAQSELEAIPPFREPAPSPSETTQPTQEPTTPVIQPTPEPVQTTTPEAPAKPELPVDISVVDPQSLSDTQVVALVNAANEILASAPEGSPEYNKALDALFVAAQADDIQVDSSLASIPGVGQAAVAAIAAINFMGNVGSDMAPATRAKAKKEVIATVVATGAAVSAATGAATSAATTGSTGGSGGSSGGSSGGNEKTESNKPNRRETR